MTIRLLLVDDHTIFREALRLILSAESDIEVVGEAANGREALGLARSLAPDIIVLDIGMPDMNGVEAAAALHERSPRARVIALSTHSDRRYVAEMIKAGVRGYVVKTAASTELLRAIRAVSAGQSFFSPAVSVAVVRSAIDDLRQVRAAVSELTRRERDVLTLIAEGQRTAGIAKRLKLAESTVEAYRRNLMSKLDIHSVAELTKYALREGLTDL